MDLFWYAKSTKDFTVKDVRCFFRPGMRHREGLQPSGETVLDRENVCIPPSRLMKGSNEVDGDPLKGVAILDRD